VVEEGDVIVAMQLRHALSVLPRARAQAYPVVMFSSLLPGFTTVRDPYGRPDEHFREVFDLIDAGIAQFARLQGGRLPTPPLVERN